MSQGIVGYNIKWFAREAKKVIIDIDEEELKKNNIEYELKIKMDLSKFFDLFNKTEKSYEIWNNKCLYWKNKWNNEMPINYLDDSNGVNPYNVLNKFYNIDVDNKITTCSAGSIVTNLWHSILIKNNDRYIMSSQGDMGFELTSAIGCQIANPDKKVICVVGDGSIQLNIQELQTIVHYKLPIKILLFNNSSYGANVITQTTFFGNKYGVNKDTGISFPDFRKLCIAYDIKYIKIEKKNCMHQGFKSISVILKPGIEILIYFEIFMQFKINFNIIIQNSTLILRNIIILFLFASHRTGMSFNLFSL
jgi:acetolactate synthase-1/2/3 large subunit